MNEQQRRIVHAAGQFAEATARAEAADTKVSEAREALQRAEADARDSQMRLVSAKDEYLSAARS